MSSPVTIPNSALSYVEGLEAYFGCSMNEVAQRLRAAVNSGPRAFADTGFDDFLDIFCEQTSTHQSGLVAPPPAPTVLARRTRGSSLPNPLRGMPILDPGETRPLLMMRVGDRSPWGKRYPAGDAKTVMLYSRELIVMDPSLAFTNYWKEAARNQGDSENLTRSEREEAWLAGYGGLLREDISDHYVPQSPTLEGLSREEWLVRAVEQYASLESAIRRGYVDTVFVDPNSRWSSWRPSEEYIKRWVSETGMARDAERINESVLDILLAVSIASTSPGTAHVVSQPGFQEELVKHFRTVLDKTRAGGRGGQRMRTLTAIPEEYDRRMLNRLFELNLPGVDFTQVRDLVLVRESEFFSETRIAIRDAVQAAEGEETQEAAQTAAQATLRDHADVITRESRGGLNRVLLQNSVTLGISGFQAASLQNWQLALPGMAQMGIDVTQDRHQQRARRVQSSLYIALSKRH